MKKTWIKIRRGLLTPEHRKAIGNKIWVYFYILDNDDWTPEDVARHYDMPIALVKKQARDLAADGYVDWQPEHYKHARADVIPETIRWAVWNRDEFCCVHCGTSYNLTLDHIIPQKQGGKTEADNLQTLCRCCNSTKGSR